MLTLFNKTEVLILDTIEHEFPSNADTSIVMMALKFLICGMILGTNVPLIVFILNQEYKTFLDWLIVFDCFLCISNPVNLLGDLFDFWMSICGLHIFFSFLTNICNRLLTVGIAFYRFSLVLGSSHVSPYQKKILEKLILLVILLVSLYMTGWAVHYRENYRYFLGIE